MKYVLGLVLAIQLVLAPPSWAAGFTSGNELWTKCNESPGFNLGMCMGYIVAMADVLGSRDGVILGFRACIPPDGVTRGQVKDIVVKHLQENPQLRHYAAAGLVADALQRAFPCR